MKVTIHRDNSLSKDEVILQCTEENEYIDNIYNFISTVDKHIIAFNNDEKRVVGLEEIYYFESVDKKTFIYLQDSVLECSLRLYQIEEKLMVDNFFRATKSTIVNIRYIKKIVLMINRNLTVTLSNDEKLIISRRRVKEFKEKIGWGK